MPQTHPELRDLLRVIPIGQTQQHEGMVLTLLALEVYADGCLLTVLMQRDQVASWMMGDRMAQPESAKVTMADDCGGAYTGRLDGLRSSTGLDFWQGRAECACTPTLDPAARELHVEISDVRWERWEETDQGELRRHEGEILDGPWVYIFQFAPATP